MAHSVLVVDDDPAFRALAGRLLRDSGLTVVAEAASVSDALATAVRVKPAAVLVDFCLPDGNGLALARELVGLPWQPAVVLTSVDHDAASSADVRASGASAFVNKADLPNAPLLRLLGGE